MSDHIGSLVVPPGTPIKVCRGCGPLPRTTANFQLRLRNGHKPCWSSWCRKCKHERRDRPHKAAVKS